MKQLFYFLSLAFIPSIFGQENILTYAGNGGKECFYDVTQLNDGTVLVCGYAENLDWVPPQTTTVQINPNSSIPNALGTNRYGIILHLTPDLSQILELVHFPQGSVEDIKRRVIYLLAAILQILIITMADT
jgi:hypothetical protein